MKLEIPCKNNNKTLKMPDSALISGSVLPVQFSPGLFHGYRAGAEVLLEVLLFQLLLTPCSAKMCVCQVCERSDELLVNMGLSDFSH